MVSLALKPIEHYLRGEDIHDARREHKNDGLATGLLSVLLGVVHGITLYLLVWNHIGLMMWGVVHVLLVAIAGIYARIRLSTGGDPRFALLLTLTTAVMGVFGAAGCLLSVLMHALFNRYAHSFAEWFETIFPSAHLTPGEIVNDNLLTGRDEAPKTYSVVPFLDVMIIGSEEQKREALGKMTSQFHPSFASAFRRALEDENNAIRVQAATAIAKIENQFLEQTIQIEMVRRKHPKDDQVLLALARHYDNYAYTGILDAEREESNRAKALDAYMLYLKNHPSEVQIRMFVGRLMIRSEKTAQAAEWFRQSIDAGYSTPQMITWYMECLFKLGRYSELRSFAARFHHSAMDQGIEPSLVDSVQLWSAPVQEVA